MQATKARAMLVSMKQTIVSMITFLLATLPTSAGEIAGRAIVVDGDTIAVEGTEPRIRLWGIDAPEGRQTCNNAHGEPYLCGPESADALYRLIGRNGRVICHEMDRDRYNRIVSVCEIGGKVLNAEMVRLGWAVDFIRYSSGAYAAQEAEARTAQRGLWAGQFVMPWQWRAGQRLSSEHSDDAQRDCAIKGNISKAGSIYHMPGSLDYERTRIDESRGERWFCSEEEAKAAGWRAPRG